MARNVLGRLGTVAAGDDDQQQGRGHERDDEHVQSAQRLPHASRLLRTQADCCYPGAQP